MIIRGCLLVCVNHTGMTDNNATPPSGNGHDNGAPDDATTSPRVLVTVLIVLVVLFGGGYLLVTKMIAMRHLEDCQMSGRKDCVPLDAPAR